MELQEAPTEQRRADRDSFLQRLRQCRERAVQVLSSLGPELAKELEAGLFLQLDDTWTMDCNKEDVEDTLHVRRCKGCLCFASRFLTPGQTGYTAEHAQQILEGFPKPPPAAPKPPTATTEMLVDTEVIEEFPEDNPSSTHPCTTGARAKPMAARKRAGGQGKMRGKRKKQSQVTQVASKLNVPGELSEEGGAKKHEEFLWTAGLESQKQMTKDEKDEILQSQGSMPCKLPDGSLPFDHGSNNGCVGNLWMQLPGSMPCKLPDCSLPFDHGSSNGSVGNLWMQSQGSMPCNFPDGSLPSDHGSNHGCDGNLRMQSEGPAPYTQPIDSFAAPSNESGLGGNLWMKPQQSGKVEGHGKPWMHVGFAHPHTPDRSRSTTAKEDENFAMAGSVEAPDASSVPLPRLAAVKMAKVLAEIKRILSVVEPVPHSNAAARRWAREVLRLESDVAPSAASKAFRIIAREIHPDGRAPLLKEEELQCHEALAKLQRARRLAAATAKVHHLRRPERVRVEVRNNDAWWITWQQREESGVRYELRVQDGQFLVTIAELNPVDDLAAKGFEVRVEGLSPQLQEVLRSNGWLGVRVAALDITSSQSALSDEAMLSLRELKAKSRPTMQLF